MQIDQTILPSSVPDVKLLHVLLALFALKGAVKGLSIGLGLVLILALYWLVASALVEVTDHITDLWMSSGSVVRLLMLVIAVYVIRKATPYVLQLHKRGII